MPTPLSRDQRNLRAAGAFFGCAVAIVCAFWLVRHVDVRADWRVDASEADHGYYDDSWQKYKMSVKFEVWHTIVVDQTLCNVWYDLKIAGWTLRFGEHDTVHANVERDASIVRGAMYFFEIILVFGAFRATQIVARLLIPTEQADPFVDSD